MQITHSSLIHQKISLALNMRITLSLINLFIYCFIYLLQLATIVTICNDFVTICYNLLQFTTIVTIMLLCFRQIMKIVNQRPIVFLVALPPLLSVEG
jgi:hypothetical protein